MVILPSGTVAAGLAAGAFAGVAGVSTVYLAALPVLHRPRSQLRPCSSIFCILSIAALIGARKHRLYLAELRPQLELSPFQI